MSKKEKVLAASGGKVTTISSKQEVTQQQEESKALVALFNESTITGFEEASANAFSIPFLRILQDLSPQVKKLKKGYIPGARPGQIFNTVTKELNETIRVIPCYYQQTNIEWRPRSVGGGFVTVHPAETPLRLKVVKDPTTKHDILPNGNELADTRSHFVLLVREDDSTMPCILPMSYTGISTSKTWMAALKVACAPSRQYVKGLPTFAWSYQLATEEESNDQGSWFKWSISDPQMVHSIDVFEAASAFAKAAREGNKGAKVDYNDMRDTTQDDQQGGAAPDDLDNEIDA
jgi:hypothetical protein